MPWYSCLSNSSANFPPIILQNETYLCKHGSLRDEDAFRARESTRVRILRGAARMLRIGVSTVRCLGVVLSLWYAIVNGGRSGWGSIGEEEESRLKSMGELSKNDRDEKISGEGASGGMDRDRSGDGESGKLGGGAGVEDSVDWSQGTFNGKMMSKYSSTLKQKYAIVVVHFQDA